MTKQEFMVICTYIDLYTTTRKDGGFYRPDKEIKSIPEKNIKKLKEDIGKFVSNDKTGTSEEN